MVRIQPQFRAGGGHVCRDKRPHERGEEQCRQHDNDGGSQILVDRACQKRCLPLPEQARARSIVWTDGGPWFQAGNTGIDRNMGSRVAGTSQPRTVSGHTAARAASPGDAGASMRALRRMSVGQRAVGLRGQKLLPGNTLTNVQPTRGKRRCAGSAPPRCCSFPACGTRRETARRAQGTECSAYAE
jgi:hypothetical protein